MRQEPDNRPVKPLLVHIHTEPDGTFLRRDEKDRWQGFEKGVRLLSDLRGRIEERTGATPHFTWQFRADSQIARQFGAAGWAFDRYAGEIASLQHAGDDIGLHQHAYRWDQGKGAWIEDFGDLNWMEDVVTAGFEVFRQAFGRAPESFAAGVTWTSTELVRLVERLGAKYDTTAAPGRNKPFPTTTGEFKGELPNTDRMPLHPYHPSLDDFLVSAPERENGLWIIPLTTGCQSEGGTIKRNLRRVTGRLARHEMVTKLYLQSPIEYLSPVFDANTGGTEPSHFTLDIRSDAFRTLKNRLRIKRNIDYLTSPDRPWKLVFTNPAELIEQVQRVQNPGGLSA